MYPHIFLKLLFHKKKNPNKQTGKEEVSKSSISKLIRKTK